MIFRGHKLSSPLNWRGHKLSLPFKARPQALPPLQGEGRGGDGVLPSKGETSWRKNVTNQEIHQVGTAGGSAHIRSPSQESV